MKSVISRAISPPETPPFVEVRLTGPAPALDYRVAAVRGDIVDIGLAGQVSASRYVAPEPKQAICARTPMLSRPDPAALAVSELLFGESFEVFDSAGDWYWGRTVADHYLGWVRSAALSLPGPESTHGVVARRAPVFAAPDIKSPVIAELPFGARLSGSESGNFLALDGGGHVHIRHVGAALATVPPHLVARTFTAAPYVWGGRTPDGVDCSGLVQAALRACGIDCPRDTDQQLAALGRPVPFDERAAGDLVYFPGHVGFLVDGDRLFHANAYWMTTLEEPLADVIARLESMGVAEPVSGVRRLSAA